MRKTEIALCFIPLEAGRGLPLPYRIIKSTNNFKIITKFFRILSDRGL